MMKVYVNALITIGLLMFSACSMLKRVDLTKISIGMSKTEVVAALGKQPENTVAAKEYEDGILEVLEYHDYMSTTSSHSTDDRFTTYWLYFFNDRLVEWGKPPLDLEVYVERIYKQRSRPDRR